MKKNYQIKELIAKGGMAEVYLASYEPLDGFSKPVVIKKILDLYAEDIRWIESFLNEAKIMSLLNHSNIIHVYDFGKSKQGYYLMMEYVDGGSLLDLKKIQPILPEKIVLYLALEILKGLSHAHKKGVLHRDLSPSNILISREGEVKITDFGIAKLKSTSSEKTEFLKGKLTYMSPEQKAQEPLTPASDLYALSVMLYELLTGKAYKKRKDVQFYPFLKQGLKENPKQRVQSCEAYEMSLLKHLHARYGYVTQRDLQKYIETYTAWKKRKTFFLAPTLHPKSAGKKFIWKWAAAALFLLLALQPLAKKPNGYLSLNASPWAEVYVDDHLLGTTPLVKRSLPVGSYDLVIKNQELQHEKHVVLDIKENEISKLRISFD